MSHAQLEARVMALEQSLAELQVNRAAVNEPPAQSVNEELASKEDELIPGTEHPIVLLIPPKKITRFKARLRSVQPGTKGLALSDGEWESLRSIVGDGND